MTQVLTFVTLFLLPFLVLPLGISPFETPKVFGLEILIVFTVLLSIFRNISLKIDNFFLYLSGGLVLLIIFQLISNFSEQLLLGNNFRMQGGFLLSLLILWAIFSGKLDLKKNSYLFLTLLSVELLAALLINSGRDRSVGTLGEPNSLSAFVIFLWPISFWFLDKKKKVIPAILAFVIIYLSGSRSGLIAYLIQLIFLLLVQLKVELKKTILLSIMLIFLSFTLPFFDETSLFENRGEIWRVSYLSGLSKPIFGWGFGNTNIALHQTSVSYVSFLRGQFVDSAHNLFLDFWVQSGVVGLSLITLILFLAFKNLVQENKKLELAILLGLITALSFNPMSAVILAEFWWVIGQAFKKVA